MFLFILIATPFEFVVSFALCLTAAVLSESGMASYSVIQGVQHFLALYNRGVKHQYVWQSNEILDVCVGFCLFFEHFGFDKWAK